MGTLILKLLITCILITSVLYIEAQDLRDKHGIKTGSVDGDGIVRNKHGIKLGAIDDNGDVRDKYGNRIGKAKNMDKEKAAFLFFFR